MRAIRRSLLPALAVVFCAVPLSSWAGCNRPVVVQSASESGAVCWQHVGGGTAFTGAFGARQHVTAAAIGQFSIPTASRNG